MPGRIRWNHSHRAAIRRQPDRARRPSARVSPPEIAPIWRSLNPRLSSASLTFIFACAAVVPPGPSRTDPETDSARTPATTCGPRAACTIQRPCSPPTYAPQAVRRRLPLYRHRAQLDFPTYLGPTSIPLNIVATARTPHCSAHTTRLSSGTAPGTPPHPHRRVPLGLECHDRRRRRGSARIGSRPIMPGDGTSTASPHQNCRHHHRRARPQLPICIVCLARRDHRLHVRRIHDDDFHRIKMITGQPVLPLSTRRRSPVHGPDPDVRTLPHGNTMPHPMNSRVHFTERRPRLDRECSHLGI